jgi:hypothetical protein
MTRKILLFAVLVSGVSLLVLGLVVGISVWLQIQQKTSFISALVAVPDSETPPREKQKSRLLQEV